MCISNEVDWLYSLWIWSLCNTRFPGSCKVRMKQEKARIAVKKHIHLWDTIFILYIKMMVLNQGIILVDSCWFCLSLFIPRIPFLFILKNIFINPLAMISFLLFQSNWTLSWNSQTCWTQYLSLIQCQRHWTIWFDF